MASRIVRQARFEPTTVRAAIYARVSTLNGSQDPSMQTQKDRSVAIGRVLAGWRFFCIAGEIKAIVLGFEGQKNVRRAVKRMLARLKSEKFNSLEITRVASKRFLGVPYVSVSARSRHIQESLFLLRDKDLRKFGSSKIDCRLDQSMGLAGSKGLLQGTMIQAKMAPVLNR